MRSWFLVTVMALVSLAGCSPDHVWHGDVSFTDEERQAIEAGAAFVAEQTGQEPLAIVWDLPPGDEAPNRSIRSGHTLPNTNAMRLGHLIRIDTAQFVGPERIGQLAAVTAHEVGHEYGLEHHAGLGIMSEGGCGGTLTWSAGDVAGCIRDGVCASR